MSKGVIDLNKSREEIPGVPAHSPFGPSAAEGWMNCPAYVRMNAMYPEDTSVYAAEGTCAHGVAERALRKGKDIRDYKGKVFRADGFDLTVDEAVIRNLQPGLDRIREFGGKIFVEEKVNLAPWLPGNFGTLDRGVVTKKLIVIGDLKYGAGEPVFPKKNKQLRLYGLGFWKHIARHLTKATRFKFIIDQPRHSEGGGEWECDLDELLDFGKKVKAAYKAAQDEDAPRIPSAKACRWCKHKDNCEEREAWSASLIKEEFKMMERLQKAANRDSPLFMPEFDENRLERFLYIHRHASQIREFLDMIHRKLLEAGIDGVDLQDYMVAPGRRGSKRWRDEKKAEAKLKAMFGSKAFLKTLKSPTQLIADIDYRKHKEKLDKLITQDEGKPALVLKSSGKERILSIKDEFKQMNERSR